MDIQRVRTLTTGRLHTKIDHVYQDIDCLTGIEGAMTHMIPRAIKAIEPWLRERVSDERFWNGEYDTEHCGEIDLPPMTEEERALFLSRFKGLPDPLEGKDVVSVIVSQDD